jgi:hypothetical protein
VIPNISINNVLTVPYTELLEAIGAIALEKLPEGGQNDPARLQEIDRLLARFANLHSYLVYLWAFVSHTTNSRKLMGDSAGHLDAAKRKETLYEIAASVKLKQEAVSRMLTVQQLMKGELHEHRVYNKDTPFEATAAENKASKSGRPGSSSWASVPK